MPRAAVPVAPTVVGRRVDAVRLGVMIAETERRSDEQRTGVVASRPDPEAHPHEEAGLRRGRSREGGRRCECPCHSRSATHGVLLGWNYPRCWRAGAVPHRRDARNCLYYQDLWCSGLIMSPRRGVRCQGHRSRSSGDIGHGVSAAGSSIPTRARLASAGGTWNISLRPADARRRRRPSRFDRVRISSMAGQVARAANVPLAGHHGRVRDMLRTLQ
jgi:hypothetical protein